MAKESFIKGKNPGIGKGETANLPKGVQESKYPKASHYPNSDIDDTMEGIDDVCSRTVSKASKHKSNQK